MGGFKKGMNSKILGRNVKMLTNIIIKDVSLMIDTEENTCHFADGTIGIYISGTVRIDKDGNVISADFEQERR